MPLQQLTANLADKVRSETLDGKNYLVAPLSMIVPGVLNGSKGPLLYPLDEITRSADAWNGMPIVVNHPHDGSRPVSARSPHIIRNFGVGTVYNATTEKGKLAAEGWFDVEKTKTLSPSTYEKLTKNEPEELSTGLFTDNEPVKNLDEAEFNGRKYTHIARNYRPDHLAILPDKKGACSIKDGCGVNVNEGGSDNDCDDWGTKNESGQAQNGEPSDEDLNRHLDWDEVRNGASFSDIHSSIEQALQERFGRETWPVDVFMDHVVFRRDDKLVKLDYTIDLDSYEVDLDDSAPQEVRRVTEYKTVENESCNCGPECDCEPCRNKHWFNLIPNQADVTPDKACKILEDGEIRGKKLTKDQRGLFAAICDRTQNEEAIMALTKEQKEQIVSNLIANTGVDGKGPWEEGDKEALTSLPESKLIAMNEQRELLANGPGLMGKKKMEDDEEEEKTDNEASQSPTVNTKPKTTQEWLAEAPPEIRSVVNNAMAFEKKQKDDLINVITKNERNPFTKEYLESKDLQELQGIAALAANEDNQPKEQPRMFTPHYVGVPGFTQNLGENFSNEDQDMSPESWD